MKDDYYYFLGGPMDGQLLSTDGRPVIHVPIYKDPPACFTSEEQPDLSISTNIENYNLRRCRFCGVVKKYYVFEPEEEEVIARYTKSI